jgi:type II secretory pathway component PulF
MASHSSDQNMAGVCLMLSDRLSAGHPLSNAMSLFPRVFDQVVVGLISAAERSGHLHETLTRLAETEERRYELRRNLISAATYPAVLVASTLLLTCVFFFYVFPLNKQLIGSVDRDMPFFSRAVAVLAGFLGSPWAPFLLLVAVGGAVWALKTETVGKKLSRVAKMWVVRAPVVGSVVRKAEALDMLRVLDLIISGGGTTDTALKFMIETAPQDKRRLLGFVRREVMEGADFSEALRAHHVFPPLVTSLLEVGYETGRLDKMARHGVTLCEQDVQHAIDTAVALIEPVLLLFSGCVAGVAIITSALPLLQLINSL